MPHVRIVIEGDAAAWDPENPGPFAEKAGSQLIRTEGGTAIVRTKDGPEMPVYPGWLAVRPDGSADGEARFTTPENAEELSGAGGTVS
jgi:hypothetical protein